MTEKKLKNNIFYKIIIIFFVLLINSACSDIRNFAGIPSSTCEAGACHSSTQLKKMIPESGKHTVHLNAGYTCDNCHRDYLDNINHKNGILDVNDNTDIIFFDSLNPGSTWDNPGSNCENVACHGEPNTVNWYTASTGCMTCHSPGSVIDPETTNGSGSDGKHTAHLKNPYNTCDKCHYNYKLQPTHMNSIYGRAESEKIVYFDSSLPGASWNNPAAECSGVCHIDISWYSTAGMACTDCHILDSGKTFPDTPDPVASGNHSKHLTGYNLDCGTCHKDYRASAAHNNGVMNNPGTTPGMVNLNAPNSPGAVYNSGNRSCGNTYCHSNGQYARKGCVTANLSPAWDSAGTHAQGFTPQTWRNVTAPGGPGGIVNRVYAGGNGSVIYAATDSGLSVSTDRGLTWINYTTAGGLGNDSVNDVNLSSDGSAIYAATDGGLSVSTDGGSTWSNYNTSDGLGDNVVNDVFVSSDGIRIYAATDGGLSISLDSGSSWTNYTTAEGLGSNRIYDVFVSSGGSRIYAGTSGQLSISLDSGAGWTNYLAQAGEISSIISVYVNSDGTRIYAAGIGGVMISVNSGNSWTKYYNTVSGVDSTPRQVQASEDGTRIYIANGPSTNIVISTDSGLSFTRYSTNIGTVRGIYVNPVNNGIYVAGNNGISISPYSGSCDVCHGYYPGSSSFGSYSRDINTGSHTTHINTMQCSMCHAETTDEGVTVSASGKSAYHVNGSYNISPGGKDITGAIIDFTYDNGTHTCSSASGKFAPGCHVTRAWADRNDDACTP